MRSALVCQYLQPERILFFIVRMSTVACRLFKPALPLGSEGASTLTQEQPPEMAHGSALEPKAGVRHTGREDSPEPAAPEHPTVWSQAPAAGQAEASPTMHAKLVPWGLEMYTSKLESHGYDVEAL